MDLVVDANIIIAAIIKESTSYTLLFREDFHLYTAEYIFTEIEEHKEEILKKTKKTEPSPMARVKKRSFWLQGNLPFFCIVWRL